jgi:hypothetical protein
MVRSRLFLREQDAAADLSRLSEALKEPRCAIPARRFPYHFGALRQLCRKQAELVAAPGAMPPDKANFPRRFIGEQRAGNEIGPQQQSRIERQGWQQGGAAPRI